MLKVVAFGVVLSITSCASTPPPTGELAAARQAVNRASDADADQYAADDLSRARIQLEQAQSLLAAGRDDDARAAALLAAAAGDLANARSRDAVADNELAQKRAEITRLRQQLRMEDGQ